MKSIKGGSKKPGKPITSTYLRQKNIDTDVYTLAKYRINRAYDLFDKIVVSFSGGKDSTVILNIAREVAEERGKLPLEVIFFDEEALHFETIEYVKRVNANPDYDLKWFCLDFKHINSCSKSHPYWYCWNKEEEHLWCRPMPNDAITYVEGWETGMSQFDTPKVFYPKSLGITIGLIVGLRAQESLRRRRVVSNREHDNFIGAYADSKNKQYRHIQTVKPIYDWLNEDVWSAPKIFGWDYNITYDIYDKLGISLNDQRVAPPYGQQPLRNLWMYAQGFPELWEKLLERVPGAATAARYSRTPLYALGTSVSSVQKPDNQSWKEYIQLQLDKWPPDVRGKVANRIKNEIRKHYRKTSDPIPDEERHLNLETGVSTALSWRWLAKVAQSGDFKGRLQPNYYEAKNIIKMMEKKRALENVFKESTND